MQQNNSKLSYLYTLLIISRMQLGDGLDERKFEFVFVFIESKVIGDHVKGWDSRGKLFFSIASEVDGIFSYTREIPKEFQQVEIVKLNAKFVT